MLRDVLISVFTFNRLLAKRLSALLIKTSLRPNEVTGLSLLAGFLGAAAMSVGTRRAMLVGAFFLQFSFILDNCDGEIARAKHLQSKFGMWYDCVADLLVDFALWVGLAVGSAARGEASWVGALGAAAVASVGSLANFLRVAFRRVKGHSGKELPPESRNAFLSALHMLSQDADPTIFIWLLALAGSPFLLLILGACYIFVIWLSALFNLEKRIA